MKGDKVWAKDMIYGKIYVGGPVGEFQKDKEGRIWFKSGLNGSIQQVNPHPSSLFTELRDIDTGEE